MAGLKKIYYSVFKKHPIVYYQSTFLNPVGNFIAKYFGNIIFNNSSKEKISISKEKIFVGTNNLMEFVIITHLNNEFAKLNEQQQKDANREDFWGSIAGKNWHKSRESHYNNNTIFESEYLTPRAFLIENLQKHIHDNDIKTVIEIGTGSGKLIKHLSDTSLKHISYIGLDINEEIIKENSLKYNNCQNLKFISAETKQFLSEKIYENCCILSTGTLEFFTENELNDLLETLQNKYVKISFAICEPVDHGYDKSETSTYRGVSTFYSHNYLSLFKKNNFGIEYTQLPYTAINPYNLLTIIATKKHGI